MPEPSVSSAENQIQHTPLYDLHLALGAKMVPFAGFSMPLSYPLGIMGEHLHCRAQAGLFDVSHMGQAMLEGADFTTMAKIMEGITSAALTTLKPGQMRYTLLLNEAGGILDDLMIFRPEQETDDRLFMVVNAARKNHDMAYIQAHLPDNISLIPLPEKALIAVQGVAAEAVLQPHIPKIEDLFFLEGAHFPYQNEKLLVTRSGYTGEDGFEISLPASLARDFCEKLLADSRLAPVGLGARDSLRLEAGLCLYGHDMDENTTPFEASLGFAVSKARLRAGDMPGAERLLAQWQQGVSRQRVGLVLSGRAPAREGAGIYTENDTEIGRITSGGFSPSLEKPIAMGLIAEEFTTPDTRVIVKVRNKELEAHITPLPFVPARSKRR